MLLDLQLYRSNFALSGTVIYDAEGQKKIGVVTSGSVSPCLGAAIAMGYVETPLAKEGNEVCMQVRGKMIASKVAKMPFIESTPRGVCIGLVTFIAPIVRPRRAGKYWRVQK